MRVEDWSPSEPTGPERLGLPSALPQLFATYRDTLAGGEVFANVVAAAAGAGANEVWIEKDYIDADYRDEFAHFYAQTFRHLPDRCHRLHFQHAPDDPSERYYIGFAVIRPVTGRPVSRMMLRPAPGITSHLACTTRSVASPYGYRFAVFGFPFISQDYQYGVCAHAAIWMVAHYFHLEFRGPRFYMSDIVEGARRRPGFARHTPSPGLSLEQISCALDELGMSPIVYRLDALERLGRETSGSEPAAPPAIETPATLACRYLNSRIPVIVLSDNAQRADPHAQVLIGYGVDRETDALFFISHDDRRGPYRIVLETDATDNGDSAWEYLVVPTPGRIYLPAEAAELEGVLTLGAEIARRELQELADRKEELRPRTYVTTSADYKRRLRDRGLPERVASWHAQISMSHWVWVVELQDRQAAVKGKDCVIGEIVIDATSDRLHPNYLTANLPGWVMRWAHLGAETEALKVDAVSDLYETGTALHA